MCDVNLGKEFSDRKICIKVNNTEDILKLKRYIYEWLFEDVSIVMDKLYHGVYDYWFKQGYKLSIGKINDQVEVLDDLRFKNYKTVKCDEFIENLKEW